MRDVVIVGGGLTGLSAALELEKQGVPYTLIEVKRRPGGSIQTVRQDGFVMDGAAFAVDGSIRHEPLIQELDLQDEFVPVDAYLVDRASYRLAPTGDVVAFKNGTESLIQAIAAKLTAPRLMRMAVSSIGELDNGRYALCLENGIMLDAKSIILAAPARYAERMFYGYINAISQRLIDFPYESIVRVSVGMTSPPDPLSSWRGGEKPPQLTEQKTPVAFLYSTRQPERTPPGKMLLHMSIRAKPEEIDGLMPDVLNGLNLVSASTRFIHHWSEADPIFTENHTENMAQIRALLPPGVALVGSDYAAESVRNGVANLANRIEQGRNAARQMVAFLKASLT